MANDESKIRLEIGRAANYEIQMLATLLADRVATNCPDAEISAIARGILKRISDLSDIVYESFINDESERESVGALQRHLGQRLESFALAAEEDPPEAGHG